MSREVLCDLDYKEFNIECRRIYKIFLNSTERSVKFGRESVVLLSQENQKEQMYVSEMKKENERKEIIKDTLKTTIKLRTKLKDQHKLIFSEVELDEKLVTSVLKQFITNQ